MTIDIVVNGEPRSLPAGTSVAQLISELGLVSEQVAVERNASLVRRGQHAQVALEHGDRLEIVTLVGGG